MCSSTKNFSGLVILLLLLQQFVFSQSIKYSTLQKNDKRNIYFEIIGKQSDNYLVYKKKSGNHFLAFYDASMQLTNEVKIPDIPDKAYDLDFIKGNDFLTVIYQYQKSNIIYCGVLRLNNLGDPVVSPKIIDTSRVSFFSDNKIYSSTTSDDKKQILIYKRNIKADQIYLSAITLDVDLKIVDRYKEQLPINVRKESYSDFYINNEGVFVYCKQGFNHQGDYANTLTIFSHHPKEDSLRSRELDIKELFISDPILKFDNFNNKLVIASLYYQNKRGNVSGIFATQVDPLTLQVYNRLVNRFSNTLKEAINKNNHNRNDFEDLLLQQIIPKKNGGFLLLAEDFYSETYSNNRWDRNLYYPYYSPYSSLNDYYLYNPYGLYYRPDDASRNNQNVRYYYNDIIVASFDSLYNLKWDVSVSKKQMDVEQDNFLSYILVNTGKEINFLFLNNEGNKNIISRNSVSSTGEVKRYATINSFEKEYEFMPKLSKQIGSNLLIMPFFYLNRLGFAKIELN